MIIALLGKAGAGKDTVAKMIAERYAPGRVGSVALAAPLKKFCQEVFDFSDDQLYGPSDWRNQEDTRYQRDVDFHGLPVERPHAGPPFLTPRYALQTLGTEWGRNCYEDVWVDLALRKCSGLLKGTPGWGGCRIVTITDCRFVNEARAVRAAGGVVWRITREAGSALGSAAAHVSETEQDSEEMTRYLTLTTYNTGSLSELKWNVHSALNVLGADKL